MYQVHSYDMVKKEKIEKADKYTLQSQGAFKFVIKNKPKVEVKVEPVDRMVYQQGQSSSSPINSGDSRDCSADDSSDCSAVDSSDDSSDDSSEPSELLVGQYIGGCTTMVDETTDAVNGLLDNELSSHSEQYSYAGIKSEIKSEPVYNYHESEAMQEDVLEAVHETSHETHNENSTEMQSAINSILPSGDHVHDKVGGNSMDMYMNSDAMMPQDDINAAVQSIL